MKIGKILILVLLIAIFLVLAERESHKIPGSDIPIAVRLNSTLIEVEVATTEKALYQGLSDRDVLKSNHGLLLVFDKEDYHSIVMRDMNFSIDVIWIDKNLEIVDIKTIFKPTDKNIAKPSQPALYVLEVNAGLTGIHDIKIGDKVQFINQ
jgi:uncharacterized protein